MSHNEPCPGDKFGWFQDENERWSRPWDNDDELHFMNYLEALSELGRGDLMERYRLQKLFECPDTLLNRMAGRIVKLAGAKNA